MVHFQGDECESILTTLGPLLAAVPGGQFRRVSVFLDEYAPGAVTPEQVRRMGQLLPTCVTRLTVRIDGPIAPGAWRALLPSLPASVERVELQGMSFTEQELVDMCVAATRRVTVVVGKYQTKPHLVAAARARLGQELRGGGGGWKGGQRGEEKPLVTLMQDT